ncbi:MAG: hypothetical protein OXC63_06705 [Aestuariivita sp.]|nr:hypothetical protein [Aestuariivita sp.]
MVLNSEAKCHLVAVIRNKFDRVKSANILRPACKSDFASGFLGDEMQQVFELQSLIIGA